MDAVDRLRDRSGTHAAVLRGAEDDNPFEHIGYVFRVYGTPGPQGSKRALGPGRMIENSTKVGPWREAVVASVLRLSPFTRIDGPVTFHGLFVFGRPKYHLHPRTLALRETAPTEVTKTPDLDKLCRSTFDALTQSGLIRDDCLIHRMSAAKEYCRLGEAPGAYVYVTHA
jgi:Holliday junction resolvase RusA-like endonuclease